MEKQSRLACIIFLVSAAETIGDTSAMVSGGLNREITGEEIQGSLACDGYSSAMSSLFGCPPLTSFSQNVGLVAMTKVVNRFTIMMFGNHSEPGSSKRYGNPENRIITGPTFYKNVIQTP